MSPSEVLEQQLEHRSRASAERWKTINGALESWPRTLRLCLILFVATGPLDALIFVLTRR
jgi:hypothetical protein